MELHKLTLNQISEVDNHIEAPPQRAALYAGLSDAQLIGRYRKLREERDEAKKEFVLANKPTMDRMESIESALKSRLIERGAKSVATDFGTAYKTVVSQVQVKDWTAFLEEVIEREAWELLERRASKAEVMAKVEAGEELPPGLAVSQRVNLNVKKPVAKIA